MYAVVQIGSRLRRSACAMKRIVLPDWAADGGAPNTIASARPAKDMALTRENRLILPPLLRVPPRLAADLSDFTGARQCESRANRGAAAIPEGDRDALRSSAASPGMHRRENRQRR